MSGAPSKSRLLVVAGLLVIAGAAAFLQWFAPQGAHHVEDHAWAQRLHGLTPLKTGHFESADEAHSTSGTVQLFEVDGRPVLHFEGYAATNGPDVFFFVSPTHHGHFDATAVRAPVAAPEGGDGQATLRGNFVVELPAGVTPSAANSVIVWCERFGVVFGHAPLH